MTCDFTLPDWKQIIFVLIVSTAAKYALCMLMTALKKRKEVKLKKTDWKENVVYLFQFPRSPIMPNLSPFCLKLETWLRVNHIPYEVIPSWCNRSKEGKLPFVELNGEQLADSQLIMHKLGKQFNKDDKLSTRDAATARAIDRMIEGSLFYCYIIGKIVDHGPECLHPSVSGLKLPPFATKILGHVFTFMLKSRFKENSTFKHDRADVLDIQRRDLKAISDILEDKQFLFSQDQPTSTDCTVFGHLAPCYYMPFEQPIVQQLNDDFPNVRDLINRMKERVYPDWDSILAESTADK